MIPAEVLVQIQEAVLELRLPVVHKVLLLESLKVIMPVAVGETVALSVTESPTTGVESLTLKVVVVSVFAPS